jgi:hypothetical protein
VGLFAGNCAAGLSDMDIMACGSDLAVCVCCGCCSHYIVPELSSETKFVYSSRKAVSEYKEAKAVSAMCGCGA